MQLFSQANIFDWEQHKAIHLSLVIFIHIKNVLKPQDLSTLIPPPSSSDASLGLSTLSTLKYIW